VNHPARFQPGCTPGPGRPKGTVGGRARAVQIIDALITEHGDKLYDALEAEFLKNPPRFWLKYGASLLPQTLLAKVETSPTTHRWQSLLDADQDNQRTQDELVALRQEYPGQDSRILGMLADGIPLAALRAQLGRPARLVGTEGG
jgi:hypothetical protein